MSKTDISIRETILGVLKAKDFSNKGYIHSSDFRTSLSDLGYPFGSSVVEDILISCVVDAKGNINYTTLERDLVRERNLMNASPVKRAVPATSNGTSPQPWRSDIVHKEKLKAEKQAKLIQEHQNILSNAYKKFTCHQVSGDQLTSFVESLGIIITNNFKTLLRTSTTGEFTFGEFLKSLVCYDNTKSVNGGDSIGAGSKTTAELAAERARPVNNIVHSMDGDSSTIFSPQKRLIVTPKYSHLEDNHKGTRRLLADSKNFFKSSEGVKDAVFGGDCGDDSGTLLSYSQSFLQTGQGLPTQFNYNSEQKLIREQVLAALRKLDSAELSLSEFQDKMCQMGIELPETVHTYLVRGQHSGMLDLRKCVQVLDSTIFKVQAQEGVPPEALQQAKDQLMSAMKSKGNSAISGFARIFYMMDTDGSQGLSYSEFRQV